MVINNKKHCQRVYLSSRKPPKDAEIIKGPHGASYYIALPSRKKPVTSISKVILPSGKIKYIYPKGEEPQRKYYYSEKGQANEKKRRNSPKRKEYLKEYYQKNRDKIRKRNAERYRRIKVLVGYGYKTEKLKVSK
tara:strand:+ start:5721 stop:6125 length:405 start_codon:yes stop_codon:yes gene_type:complete